MYIYHYIYINLLPRVFVHRCPGSGTLIHSSIPLQADDQATRPASLTSSWLDLLHQLHEQRQAGGHS